MTHLRTNLRRLGAIATLSAVAMATAACADEPATVGPADATTGTSTTSGTSGTDTTSTTSGTSDVEADDVVDAVDAALDELAADGFEGVVVVQDGDRRIERAIGSADRERGIATAVDTVFDIGSLTKQFTGAAILRLEMDGRLAVDDTIGTHVVGLPPEMAALTLHQLLTHTAGLPPWLGADDDPVGLEEFVELVAAAGLVHQPGTVYEYSNVGYSLLAAAIEAVTGSSYEEYLRTALFEPAGMLDTGYVLPDWEGRVVAAGYDARTGDRFGTPLEQRWDRDGPYWHLRGNGGLLSTADDMLRWDEALRGTDILSTEAKEQYVTPHVPEGPGAPTSYGYGWAIFPTPAGTPLITHNGGNGFFFADFLRFPEEGLAVFLASNAAEERHEDAAFELAGLVLGVDLLELLNGPSGAAPDDCGFDGLTVEDLDAHQELDELPDSEAGRAAALLWDVLREGDAADRLDFATRHVSAAMIGGPPSIAAEAMIELQDELAGLVLTDIGEEDPLTFHLLLTGGDVQRLLSLGFDEDEPARLTCVAVSS